MPLRLPPLRGGHALELLEGSAAYFPALVRAVDAARRDVWIETYIFDFTGTGAEVAYALERAARRGVAVRLLVDGFGTSVVAPQWERRLEDAGVALQVYAPLSRWGVLWPGNWRRLHRKLCVIDGEVAFCGGINLLDDLHDPNYGVLPSPRFDFMVRVNGPLVADVGETMAQLWKRVQSRYRFRPQTLKGALFPPRPAAAAPVPTAAVQDPSARARAALVVRDNLRNRARIERAYRRAIGRAQQEVIIANAYFVPGRKLREALMTAARRGVRVQLLLQGRYEYFMQYYAARPIYGALLHAGVEIHEYSPSFLHAKVAVVDGYWATVGSSNLDPLSLLLAREANVVVEDAAFAGELRRRLLHAIGVHGQAMDPANFGARPLGQRVMEHLALLVMRIGLAVQGKKYL